MDKYITDIHLLSKIRANTEGNQETNNQKKKSILLKNYYEKLYNLESQALRSGFGKMINAKNQTNPKYSFGKEKRFIVNDKKDDLPYLHEVLEDEKYGNVNIGYHNRIKRKDVSNSPNSKKHLNKSLNINNSHRSTKSPDGLNTINFITSSNCATDFYYSPPPTYIYKYPNLPKFSFSKALRGTQKTAKTYDYYKLSYDKNTDKENIDKKWTTHVVGGDIGVDDRFSDDRKLYYDSLTPGPGRYNPNYNYFKYKQNKYGYMGIKIKDDKLRVSTNGPKKIPFSRYNIQYLLGLNQNRKILKKSWKFKFNDIIDNKFQNNNDNKYVNLFLRDKIENQKKAKNILTEGNLEN